MARCNERDEQERINSFVAELESNAQGQIFEIRRVQKFDYMVVAGDIISHNDVKNVKDHKERIKSLEAEIKRLTTKAYTRQFEIDSLEERHRQMCRQEGEMKQEANFLKSEIQSLTIRCTRYETEFDKIKNDKQFLILQLDDTTEELARMKQLIEMTTRIQDTSKLIEENESLHISIERLKEQIKNKDETTQMCNLEYQTLLGALAAQQSENRKILKISKRSLGRFKRMRTNKDREILNEQSPRAKNKRKKHMNETHLWRKRAKGMRDIVQGNLTDKEDETQESCSESSKDCCDSGNRKLHKKSVNGAILSNEDKLQKSLTLRQDTNKELNVFNITNCGSFTFKSDIKHQSNEILSDDSGPHAIDEDKE